MFSQTVEYALRAIVTIAQHRGKACTAQQIAEITQVPAPYLSKMMQGLVHAGLVISKRGLHGGFLLAKDAKELTILTVVNAVDPLKRIYQCPLGIDAHEGNLCPLHRRLDHAMAVVEDSFRETTVADLLSQPGSVTPLCEEKELIPIGLEKAKKRTISKAMSRKPKKNSS